jgi:ferredoxin
VNNAYAEAAAAKARIEIRNADTERDEKVKLEGATEAVRRVVAMLTGGAAAPVAAPARPAEPLPHGRGSEAVRPAEPLPHGRGSERVWPEPASEDPYIDSFLCTSCNDCFKINNRLFAYDGNKQAYIADARAGTFAELVKAAEGCPAKCIHPGTPRPDDQTVTPQLLAKADRLK